MQSGWQQLPKSAYIVRLDKILHAVRCRVFIVVSGISVKVKDEPSIRGKLISAATKSNSSFGNHICLGHSVAIRSIWQFLDLESFSRTLGIKAMGEGGKA